MAKLLTPEEAAEVLRLSEDQLRRYVSLGTLPAVRIGKLIRIDEAELEKFIKEQRQ